MLALRTSRVPTNVAIHVPSVQQAINMFVSRGGSLTLVRMYGTNPLESNKDLMEQRMELFYQEHCVKQIFAEVVHGRVESLQKAIDDV